MPTQEERLQRVEFDLRQFKTETVKVYGDMAFEMTIIKGLTENAIGRLATLSDTTEKRFERVDIRLDVMDAHLESMDKRLGRVETHLEQLEESMDKRLERVETHFEQLETKFDEHTTLLTQILARLPKAP
jgi:division protein CdvB (Snf7/Vps24/ESCRT-III family)